MAKIQAGPQNPSVTQENTAVCRPYQAGKCTNGKYCSFRHDLGQKLHTNTIAPGRIHSMRPTRTRHNKSTSTQERRMFERDRLEVTVHEAQAQYRLDRFAARLKAQETERRSRLQLETSIKAAFEAYQKAEQRLTQTEKNALEVKISQQEATFTTKHIVLGSALVTCGAGIQIECITSGFETCRLTVNSLPLDAKISEVMDLFVQQGINPKTFHITGLTKAEDRDHLKATVIANAEQGRAIAIGLDGIPLRDEELNFVIENNVSTDAMTEGLPRIPQVEAPSPAISLWAIAAYIAPAWFPSVATPPIPTLPPINHEFKFFSFISKNQYCAQERQWNILAESEHECYLSTEIVNERAIICISGDDQKAVGLLKFKAETLIFGKRLPAACWHRSFMSSRGRQFLAMISRNTGAYIRADWKIHTLKVYGDAEATEEAANFIKDEVHRLTLLEWTIPLKQESVGYVVREGLAALKGELGEESVSLNLSSTPCTLTIKDSEDARHALSTMLDKSVRARRAMGARETNGDCPICSDKISHERRLACGHSYCTACIRHYLVSAFDTKIFPLVCMGNNATCRAPISIPVIQDSLPPQKFNHLVEIVVSTYIDQHPQDFRYCTTPNCVQIYRCDTGEKRCPSCFAEICTYCHQGAHRGMTCTESAHDSGPTDQERLNLDWAVRNGARKCPVCRVWMQKIDGCNHMTCACGAHICWFCMLAFPQREIYQHMRQQHGGIGDGQVVAAEVGNEGMLYTVQERQAEQRALETERQRRAEENERIANQRTNEENRRQREAIRQQEIADKAVNIARMELKNAEDILRRYEAQLENIGHSTLPIPTGNRTRERQNRDVLVEDSDSEQ